MCERTLLFCLLDCFAAPAQGEAEAGTAFDAMK
jgi:hypothetical protein